MNYCLDCDSAGTPKGQMPGTFRMEVALWLLFLIPVVIFLAWSLAVQSLGGNYSVATLLERFRPETFHTELGAWLLFLLPGAFYSLWRLSGRYQGCARCGSKRIVPIDSPQAQAGLRKLTPTQGARSWVCMACGKQIFSGGRFCPDCAPEHEKDDR